MLKAGNGALFEELARDSGGCQSDLFGLDIRRRGHYYRGVKLRISFHDKTSLMKIMFDMHRALWHRHCYDLESSMMFPYRVGGEVTFPVLPHHRAYGSVHGGS